MTKQILCISLVLLLGLSVSAQTDKAVEKINKAYAAAIDQARAAESDDDQGQFGPLFINRLTINAGKHQWRAVGMHLLNLKFFYKGGESEKHMYPDQLVLVETERTDSNRNYLQRFLYDDAGSLIFYFQQVENDEMMPEERRVYFAGVKPIRVIEDGRSRDRLTFGDSAVVKGIAGESIKIKDIFLRSLQF